MTLNVKISGDAFNQGVSAMWPNNKEEETMKKRYEKPVARKVEFCYTDQVTAASDPYYALYGDPFQLNRCTWFSGVSCNIIYNLPTNTRGINDCSNPPN